MALEVKALPRAFVLDKGNGKTITLTDPNSDMSPDEVMKFHSGSYPELTNAVIEGPKVENDKATYKISTKAGKLG